MALQKKPKVLPLPNLACLPSSLPFHLPGVIHSLASWPYLAPPARSLQAFTFAVPPALVLFPSVFTQRTSLDTTEIRSSY